MEFRRAPHLVLYWSDELLVLKNYATGRSIKADPFILQILEQFGGWRSLEHYLGEVPREARSSASRVIDLLHRHRWLRGRDDPPHEAEDRFDEWGRWNPAAGLFHTATRNARFMQLDELLDQLATQASSWPLPSPVKTYQGARVTALPTPSRRGAFLRTLRERRTWRQFDSKPVDLAAFSTLLNATAGVQHWVTAKGEGRVPLKTSPSGGARHPIELYVLARRIQSLDPGVYHYASDRHVLERVPGSGELPAFDALLPQQWWYRDAAALVLFTAVFERTRWRYHSPRAYRAVLLEAGHVCQTFCLSATSLGLAPFCSMAIADAAAERLLGVDGISESVLYAAGVGTRPALRGTQVPGSLPKRPRTGKPPKRRR